MLFCRIPGREVVAADAELAAYPVEEESLSLKGLLR
jgi:hypothetical protein